MADKKPRRRKPVKSTRAPSAQRENNLAATGLQAKPTARKKLVVDQQGGADVQDAQRLLLAITRVQSLFIGEAQPAEVFGLLLQELLTLTDSEYGFIGEVDRTPEGQLFLRTHAITDIAWNAATKALMAEQAPTLVFRNMKTLFGHVMTSGKPVIANDPANDPRAGGLPPGHPPMHAFLGLPFYRGDLLTGMVGVANRPGGYDETLVTYLEPFLSTCAQLLEGYRIRRLRADAEAALRKSEERWQLAVEGSQDAIWDWDITMGTVFFSPRWKTMRGFDEQEITDSVDEWRTRIHPEDRDRVLQAVGAYLSKQSKEFREEYRAERKDGSYLWVLDRGIAHWNDQGIVVRMTGSESDVTERKLSEQALLEASTAVELAMEGISRLDEAGRYIFVNYHYAALLGYRPDELIGQSWEITVHPDDRTAVLTTFSEMLTRGKAEADLRGVKKDGSVIWKHVVIVKPVADVGKIQGHFCFARDVTERKRAEALQVAEQQALELVAKGNPLNEVLAFICRAIEVHTTPMLCSVMLVTEDRAHLSLASGPSLPEAYNQAIATIPIGPSIGSCGSAAHFRTPSIVTNIATDPLWKDYASISLAHGLKACWSQPIISSIGELLGTFAAYYREIRAPQPTDLKIVERASHIAALAIEHARMTEALRDSEARFHAFMNYSPVVSFIKDQAGRHLYVNPSFEQRFNLSFDQVRGKTNDELMPAAVAVELNENDRRVLSSGQVQELEETVPTPDGQSQHWLVLKFPLKGAKQEQLLGGVAIDMTARKRAEDALRESEARFRVLADTAPALIWMSGLDKGGIYFNTRWLDYTGRTMEQELGHGWVDGVHPDDLDRCQAIYGEAFDRRESFEIEYRLRKADGQYGWLHETGAPRFLPGGTFAGYHGICIDITGRKYAEEALRESEERFRVIADTAPALIWMAGSDKKCTYFNQQWLSYTGRTMEQEQGDGWADGVHPDDFARCLDVYSTAFDRREPFEMEYRLRKAEGEYGWIHDSGVPRFLPDGTFTGYLGSCIEITARKQAEAARETLQYAVDHGMEGFALLDRDGRYTYMNEAHAGIYGFQALELVGQTWKMLYDEEEIAHIEATAFPVLQAQGTWHGELVGRMSGGLPVHVEVGLQRLPQGEGLPEVFLCTCRDITNRKQAEENLHRTQFAMDQAVDAVYWIDPQAKILYTNKAASVMLGYTADEFLRMTVNDLNPSFPPEVWPGFWEETREKQVVSLETIHLAKDGRQIPIDIRVSFLAYGGQEFHCAYVRDISERKRVDEALRASQERFELAVRATNDGIWDWNVLTGAQYWSDRHFELFGLEPKAFAPTYEGWIAMVYPDDADRVRHATWHHLETREPYDIEVRVRMTDGSYRWFRDRGQAVWDDTGRPVRMVGSIADVTERKTAQDELEQRVVTRTEALRQSEQRYAGLVNSADGIIMEVDGETYRIIFVSQQAERILGYPVEQWLEDPMFWMDHLHPDDRKWAPTYCQDMTKQGLNHEFEYRMFASDGRIVWIRDSVSVMRDDDGRLRLSCVLLDVTKHKDIGNRLQLTQFTVDRAAQGIFWVDRNAEILYVNEAACRVLGYSRAELLTMTVHDIDPNFPPEIWPTHWEELKRRGSFTFESSQLTKAGQVRYTEITVNYLEYDGREYNCANVRDITERKLAADAIRDSELRYKLLTEATFDGIAIHDNGVLLEVNPGIERMFGYEPGELIGRSMWDLIAEESRDLVLTNMRSGVTGPYEAIGRRKDGTTFPGEIVVRPYRYCGKDVRLVAGRDITERKHLEVARLRYTEELERQVAERTAEVTRLESQRAQTERLAALGRLAAGVAHEINNPMAGIKNAFTLVRQAVDPAHPSAEFAGLIDREIARVAGIIQNMYQLCRPESRKVETVDLWGLVKDLDVLLTPQLQQRRLKFIAEMGRCQKVLCVPRGDLVQVLLNLLTNAIDSSPDGATIALHLREEAEWIRLAVCDQGEGVASEHLPKIFDPFYTTKTGRDQKGMGLGLSVSQSLVQAMGGKIEVDTQPGRGSTFMVLLPSELLRTSMSDQSNISKEVVTHDR